MVGVVTLCWGEVLLGVCWLGFVLVVVLAESERCWESFR